MASVQSRSVIAETDSVSYRESFDGCSDCSECLSSCSNHSCYQVYDKNSNLCSPWPNPNRHGFSNHHDIKQESREKIYENESILDEDCNLRLLEGNSSLAEVHRSSWEIRSRTSSSTRSFNSIEGDADDFYQTYTVSSPSSSDVSSHYQTSSSIKNFTYKSCHESGITSSIQDESSSNPLSSFNNATSVSTAVRMCHSEPDIYRATLDDRSWRDNKEQLRYPYFPPTVSTRIISNPRRHYKGSPVRLDSSDVAIMSGDNKSDKSMEKENSTKEAKKILSLHNGSSEIPELGSPDDNIFWIPSEYLTIQDLDGNPVKYHHHFSPLTSDREINEDLSGISSDQWKGEMAKVHKTGKFRSIIRRAATLGVRSTSNCYNSSPEFARRNSSSSSQSCNTPVLVTSANSSNFSPFSTPSQSAASQHYQKQSKSHDRNYNLCCCSTGNK